MKNDGGAAFPRTEDAINNKNKDFDLDGMSLRDYFAGRVLVGILSGKEPKFNAYTGNPPEKMSIPEWVSATSYYYADAMLKAREATDEE